MSTVFFVLFENQCAEKFRQVEIWGFGGNIIPADVVFILCQIAAFIEVSLYFLPGRGSKIRSKNPNQRVGDFKENFPTVLGAVGFGIKLVSAH